MTNESSAPATKEDIRLMMEQMGKYFDATEGRFADVQEEIQELRGEIGGIRQDVEGWKAEIKDHFDVVAENIRHDFQGAFHDKLEQHEDRIRRLEREAGLAA